MPGCCGSNPTVSLQLGYTAEDVARGTGGCEPRPRLRKPPSHRRFAPRRGVTNGPRQRGGFDCFLAAKQVGPTGHILGGGHDVGDDLKCLAPMPRALGPTTSNSGWGRSSIFR